MPPKMAEGGITDFKSASEAAQQLQASMAAKNFDACNTQLRELKCWIFETQYSEAWDDNCAKLARDVLEAACFNAINQTEPTMFEREFTQWKMCARCEEPTGNTHLIMGLYLLHLLSSDRIGDFHTELELMTPTDRQHSVIQTVLCMEANIMEGNYARVMEESKKLGPEAAPFLEGLQEMMRLKVAASLEKTYLHLPAGVAATMLALNDVAKLQEFAMKENERKAREEDDDTMGDMTPSLTRRAPVGNVRWEIKPDESGPKLIFNRTEVKGMQIPALDTSINNLIGYATDLERIV